MAISQNVEQALIMIAVTNEMSIMQNIYSLSVILCMPGNNDNSLDVMNSISNDTIFKK
jgi:hypothetical protein